MKASVSDCVARIRSQDWWLGVNYNLAVSAFVCVAWFFVFPNWIKGMSLTRAKTVFLMTNHLFRLLLHFNHSPPFSTRSAVILTHSRNQPVQIAINTDLSGYNPKSSSIVPSRYQVLINVPTILGEATLWTTIQRIHNKLVMLTLPVCLSMIACLLRFSRRDSSGKVTSHKRHWHCYALNH